MNDDQVTSSLDANAEWLEADGLGGFASGTVGGARSRRYHALLLVATKPPAGRIVLVNGFDAWIETGGATFPISSQLYVPNVVHPDGATRLEAFDLEPWPIWRFRLGEDLVVQQEIFSIRETSQIVLSWKLVGAASWAPITLTLRPFLSGRDFHSLHRENAAFRFDVVEQGQHIAWRPYSDLPAIIAQSNGRYTHSPCWYHNFLYLEERARGLDFVEDLASPGAFEWELTHAPAFLVLQPGQKFDEGASQVDAVYTEASQNERRRRGGFNSPLDRAADAYLVKRGKGRSLIAGYPWFGDWGRDTFIAIRGLNIATGRLEEARDILLEWADLVSEGMLPNRFPDAGEAPEYNSVDASLWYVVAVHDYLQAIDGARGKDFIGDGHKERLTNAIAQILLGYRNGTRFGIRMDDDGLLTAGQPGYQLTWMDARVDGREVTPRIGKPVEVQALWINALCIGLEFSEQWTAHLARAQSSFNERFWNEEQGNLFDVIDSEHHPGIADPSMRPNQILAVGGLPFNIIDGDKARRIVDAVEDRLLTPLGLRSLAADEPGFASSYDGDVAARDGAYHQGTVWPWLMGPFVEAWVRVRGNTAQAKEEARARFLPPLYKHLCDAGLGHVSEIADAGAPYMPRGCPFQAWSLGELIRLDRVVLSI